MLINSPNISGSLTVTGNSVISGSLTVAGGINATITGSATSASYVEYSNVANKPTLVSGSEQVSFNGITDKPTLVSGSSQVTYSGLSGIPVGIVSGSEQVSFNGITDKPTLVSGSEQISFNGITDKPTLLSSSAQIASDISGAFGSVSSSIAGDINTKLNISETSSFAKTNINNQFSGTQEFNNINVNGTASFNFLNSVTGSATYIGDEYIVVNAQTDGARFAGIQVYDQESSLQHTASLSWDSLRNHWVYSNPSGSYHGGGLISGPRNTGSLGDETYPTSNTIVRGQGGDHIYDSNITDDDTTVKIKINTQVTGSLTLTGALSGTSATFNGTSASPVLTLSNSTGGTKADFTITENTGLIVNSYESTSARSIDFRVAGTSALLIASTGAATFSSSVTANSLVIKNTGVPAAQFFRDLDVVSVGTAGQNIEFGARSGSTFITGALIGGNLDNPATTGNLIFQTLNGGTLGTRLTITNTGAATFSSSVTAASFDGAFAVLSNFGDAANAVVRLGDGNTGLFRPATNTLGFTTAGSERMRITSTGNVGIGTDSPGFQLTLNKNDNNYLQIRSSDAGAAGIYFGRQNDSVRGGIYYDNSADALYFQTFNLTTNTVITSGGNVGVGTSSPISIGSGYIGLSVAGDNTSGRGGYLSLMRSTTETFRIISNSSQTEIFTMENTPLVIGTNATERMRITSGGNVGIGLTTPQYRLHVTNSDTLEGTIAIGNSLYPGLIYSSASTGEFRIDNRSSAGVGFISFYPNGQTTIGNERMRITAAGTVQPGANGTQDLGTSSLRWATVFTSDLSLSNGIGDYTIVEGENDLFLYNNKQNKVYKFVIEEVDPSIATPKKS